MFSNITKIDLFCNCKIRIQNTKHKKTDMNVKRTLLSLLIIMTTIFCGQAEKLPTKSKIELPKEDLFSIFQHPDTKYRPYVRWWLNGLRVEKKEILRELDLMKEIGLGGAEINSIGFPGDGDPTGYTEKPYLSDEWVEMIQTAVDGGKERGLVCDMIGGSGWPFGGEFLPCDKQLQMIYPETIDIDGGQNGVPFSINVKELLAKVNPPIMARNNNPLKELVYIRLMPKKVNTFTEGVFYDNLAANETVSIDVPAGKHVLYFFVKFTGFMNVINGAPGAGGPVLNHFDKSAVEFYLNKLSDKMQFNSPKMKKKVRGAFVDSFELEGANWNNTLLDEYEQYYGYSILPYLPYVIRKIGHMGDPLPENYGSEFSDEITRNVIQRVRNDFERFQIVLFKKNFIDPLNKWCHENGLQSRVQAYGRALHPLESAMYIDIPECETWMRGTLGTSMDDNNWSSGRAHSMVNKFVASGSLLSGNGKVSCEEITNCEHIFQTTLEEIKIAGDQSNMSGVNHSILHGFNYSPQEIPFPGWIMYGEYFNENNTIWPYYRLWFDYKARISAVLQNSIPQSDIAILPALEDMWSILGQQRDPFPQKTYPVYANDLWENIHQNGGGCDYVSEHIIQQASVKKGQLTFGPRSYKTLMLMEIESLDPLTAEMIAKFVAQGGKVICIGKMPYQSVGFKDAALNSSKVKAIIGRTAKAYPARFISIPAPTPPMTQWYEGVQKELEITPYVRIDKPSKWLMQNYYKSAKRDIFFMANSNRTEGCEITAEFPVSLKNKQAWIWDLETGKRYMLPQNGTTLTLSFEPTESKLIVFDNDRNGEMYKSLAKEPENAKTVNGIWKVKASHRDKSEKEFELDRLQDFNSLPFPWFRHFAGEIFYTTDVDVTDPKAVTVLDLGVVNQGISELYVNDEKIGVKWYGNHKFSVEGKMKEGKNKVTIKVTTVLGNYTKSLKDNRTAQRFAWSRDFQPLGLEGPVKMY